MEYGVRTWEYLSQIPEQKQSLRRQLWPMDTAALETRNQGGSTRCLGQVLGSDGCTLKGMPAGRKTGRVGLLNTTKWSPNAFIASICM